MIRQPAGGRRIALRVAAGLIAFGMGCGEGTAPPAPVASVSISPAKIDLVPGGTEILQAIPKDAGGGTLTNRMSEWSTSDPSIATVAAGVVTGVAIGTATITASVEGHTASIEVNVREGAVVSSAGASFSVLNSTVSLEIPAGALAQTRNISVAATSNFPANDRVVAGTTFDFGPAGATFAQPVTISIKYDPSKVINSPDSGLRLYEVVGTGWRLVPESSVNTETTTVTGKVSHFSVYGVLLQAPVATVTINRDTTVEVQKTVQFTATLKDAEQLTLNRAVTWTSSNPAIVTIDANGLARTLLPGQSTVTATAEGKTATATVTVVPGPPTALSIEAGQGQTATAGSAVSIAPAVKVTDAFGNPISGFAITFAVASGGGTITGAAATTNAAGVATLGSWTLGSTAGPNTVTASGAGLTPASVTFTASGGAGTAAIVAALSGNNQTATAGGPVATPPSVKVTDANGNPVEGFTVVFAPAAGSGIVSGGTVNTNSSGIAAPTSWVLGATPGQQTLVATAGSLSGSPINFSATAVAPVPAKVLRVSTDPQTAPAGKAVPEPPAVRVLDAADIPVPGYTVTFAVTVGGGSVTGGAAVTNEAGIASVGSWTLGPTEGPNALTATAGTLQGSPVTFSATAAAPIPAKVVRVSADPQTAPIASAVGDPPAVRVLDATNIPIPGYTVTFEVTSGGGSVTGAVAVTDATGFASVGSWRLGPSRGSNTVTATAGTLEGSPVTFSATAVAPVAAKIVRVSPDPQAATTGKAVADPPAVRVLSATDLPVADYTVTFQVTGGGGSLTGGVAVTDEAGLATVGSWILGPSPGQNTLTATAGTLQGSPVAFTANGTAPPPASIAISAGQDQTAMAGSQVPIRPAVTVVDANGVGVPGVTVVFSIRSGSGSITGANAVTNGSGVATLGSWTLGFGGNSLFASVDGLAGSPLIFNALGTANVQLVTFGDSNTDYGYSGNSFHIVASSYVGNFAAQRLGPNDPHNSAQLAGKIENRWRSNRSQTIVVVNHGIGGTTTGTGRTIVGSPNARESVNGVSRFEGEALGAAYPWSGGEPPSDTYLTGPIARVQAFTPRTSDFLYISMGTNDAAAGISTASTIVNLEWMVDSWIARGIAANHIIVTTLSPRPPGQLSVKPLNDQIRSKFLPKGVNVVDLAAMTSDDGGDTWKSASLHVGDSLHYAESVRDLLADAVVSILLARTPP
jgi:hypothetical protein